MASELTAAELDQLSYLPNIPNFQLLSVDTSIALISLVNLD
jgi:hypothetical protein